jgi:hypothetical protein
LSIEALEEITEVLPYGIREDILGYARSVRDALPEILAQAGLGRDPLLESKVIFVGGLKKLHALVSSSYWALDSALVGLSRSGVHEVRLGSISITRGSSLHLRLRQVLAELEDLLREGGILEAVRARSYSEVIALVRDGSS